MRLSTLWSSREGGKHGGKCLAEHSWTRVGCVAAQVRPGPVLAPTALVRGPRRRWARGKRRRFAHASAMHGLEKKAPKQILGTNVV